MERASSDTSRILLTGRTARRSSRASWFRLGVCAGAAVAGLLGLLVGSWITVGIGLAIALPASVDSLSGAKRRPGTHLYR